MPTRADATREQILRAAIDEFSAHGIAGARVERIVQSADVNPALIYRYFGSKAKLFDAAFGMLVGDTTGEVSMHADDLPGYAGRLVDHYRASPETVRLSAWFQLERTDDTLPAPVAASFQNKLALIEAAQRAGTVSDDLPAEQVLNLVIHLSLAGTRLTPVLMPHDPEPDPTRAAIVEAVRRIVEPAPKR